MGLWADGKVGGWWEGGTDLGDFEFPVRFEPDFFLAPVADFFPVVISGDAVVAGRYARGDGCFVRQLAEDGASGGKGLVVGVVIEERGLGLGREVVVLT